MKYRKFSRTHAGKSGIKKQNKQKQRGGTVKMQGALDAVVRSRGWSDKLYERSVFDVWKSVVGHAIAAQTAPIMLLDGVLRVDVAHQVYANELSLMKTDILSKLEKKLEGLNSLGRRFDPKDRVVDIRFRLNPRISQVKNGENGDKSESSLQKIDDIQKGTKSISPELLDQIETVVSVVNDAELREALKSLFITQCGGIKSTE